MQLKPVFPWLGCPVFSRLAHLAVHFQLFISRKNQCNEPVDFFGQYDHYRFRG
jgi:hypothetical protein